ncbi:3-hydroxyisobutyrate dehydrogenase [Brevibacillus agri]|uniref:3-hydroxyisobutyrate dehydrogenase n=1 Tax=Brevibacillus agri TaxID=51101 RepID=A0A3M8AUM0_9BACL|nr:MULTISPECIES: NAD(P)-dependent oxidoreductase [Brevibacillus]ELK41124.1 putative 2-hydroxy-3-oxopropionate reductase [Brevibacillus agri BAB-2500]MBG9564197.1 3-hydroxyisobutyrate dehydrogenase [Brevibacillus agri]MBY0053194.1 NAD(P)-dependent oxidoreductase [Brevibacillus agri]MDR9503701.1 NAD(P)-dependent oxidoreductase [Brevibacillus agri]MED1643843.1 NAD(P)-dependent oxidoreductase [Brevibacillus agri]
MADTPVIGIIGLGNMGMPMATNLVQAGYEVYGFDVNAKAELEFAAVGGKTGLTVAEVVQKTDVILTSLPSPDIVESVFTGLDGILEHARAGQTVVDTSTVTPQLNERLARASQAKGIGYLAAPVSGGVVGAKNRTLTIMVGGPKELYDSVYPVFMALGQNIFHVGERVDSGTAVKLINNLLIGFYTSAVSEGVALAKQMGLDLDLLFDILNVSYGQSRIYERNYKSFIAPNDFAPHFSLNLLLKDLRIAQEMAQQSGLSLPITAELLAIYEQSQEAGFGEQDMAALYAYICQSQSAVQS